MAFEIARIDIRPGSHDAFEAAVSRATPLFRQAQGCRSMRLLKSHEQECGYWLIVDWTDVAAHEAFRAAPAFAEWRALAGPYFTGTPMVEHGLTISIGF